MKRLETSIASYMKNCESIKKLNKKTCHSALCLIAIS